MKTIAIDFDGVIHQYSKGWHDGTCYDEPVKGSYDFLLDNKEKGNSMFILSTRKCKDILQYMEFHFPNLVFEIISDVAMFWNKKGIIGITNRKLPAHIYIDDRAYKFEGYFPPEDTINKFETWQEREKRRVVCPNKDENGNCPLHNIHCSYPECELKKL